MRTFFLALPDEVNRYFTVSSFYSLTLIKFI